MENEFLSITAIVALMIISPGPDFAIVVKNSLSYGRMAGIYAAVGIAVANACHITINLLGIGIIIAKSVLLFTIMKILGASYLIYLGYRGLRAKPILQSETPENIVVPTRGQQGFYSGFITSLLNPKACLFLLSFFSVILLPETPLTTQIGYGIWIVSLVLIWFSFVAWFLTNPLMGQKIERFKHWLERVTGGILVLVGIKLFAHEFI